MTTLPDPGARTPLVLPDGTRDPATVFLAAVLDHPNIDVGDDTYYNDRRLPEDHAATLAPYLFPGAPERLSIGRFRQIAEGVQFITATANHPMNGLSTYPFAIFDRARLGGYRASPPRGRDIVVGNDCRLGREAVLTPSARLGHGVIVGARAVVSGDVPDYAVVAGAPARIVRMRFSEDDVARLLSLAWWDWRLVGLAGGAHRRRRPSDRKRAGGGAGRGGGRSFGLTGAAPPPHTPPRAPSQTASADLFGQKRRHRRPGPVRRRRDIAHGAVVWRRRVGEGVACGAEGGEGPVVAGLVQFLREGEHVFRRRQRIVPAMEQKHRSGHLAPRHGRRIVDAVKRNGRRQVRAASRQVENGLAAKAIADRRHPRPVDPRRGAQRGQRARHPGEEIGAVGHQRAHPGRGLLPIRGDGAVAVVIHREGLIACGGEAFGLLDLEIAQAHEGRDHENAGARAGRGVVLNEAAPIGAPRHVMGEIGRLQHDRVSFRPSPPSCAARPAAQAIAPVGSCGKSRPMIRETMIDVGGLGFLCRVSGPQDAPMLLFLHGFPEYSGAWDEMLDRLSDGFLCVAPDQRGYGRSARPEGVRAYAAGKLAGDAAGVLAAFAPRARAVIGHDWGASVAYVLAFSRPDLMERLIIMNGAHPIPFQRALAAGGAQSAASQYFHDLRAEGAEARYGADEFAGLRAIFAKGMDMDWLSGPRLDAYRAAWGAPGALGAMLNWYRATPLQVADPGAPLPAAALTPLDPARMRVTMPHRLIWGMGDRALLPEATAGLEAHCDDLDRVEVAGADHWLHHQKPDEVAALIRDFAA